MLFSCYLYQRNEEKILPAPWPWNIINYFDNKLTSHVGLFESGYSYHYFKIVSTVSELFQFENKWSIVPKTMLIVGSSGIGKTTLCKEIANRWASKEILPNKNCLFLINLDDSTMPKICSLEDLENYSFHPELSNQRAREFLENDNSDIIIIIDGYKDILDHENNTFFTRLIERRILKQCLLIITVHPSALERLQKMVNVSLNVELLGFTEDGINECIQQELQEHPDKIVTLLSYLDDNEYVKGLCYIPTLLMILIQYVKKHKGLSSSFSAMKLAVSHFLHNNSFQKESGIDHFLHLSKLSFDSIRNKQFSCLQNEINNNALCDFGCSCVQEYLAAEYITELRNPCEQFELLKNFLFGADVIDTWAQLNMRNIRNFKSHSIFRHSEIKSNISDLSNLLRCYSVYTWFDHFKCDRFKMCNDVVFQALCFMHSEETYYRCCPRTKLADWYYNDRTYDTNLHNLYCWSKVLYIFHYAMLSAVILELNLFYFTNTDQTCHFTKQ